MSESLGRGIFSELHKPFNRNRHELTPDKLAASLIAHFAEVRLLEAREAGGKKKTAPKLADLVAPFLSVQDPAKKIGNNPALLDRLATAQAELAQRFTTWDRRLLAENFGVVIDESEGSRNIYAILTDPTGLTMGSWNTIMAQDEATTDAHTVMVNGQRLDTRLAMTRRVHRAMNTQALATYLAQLGPNDMVPLAHDRSQHVSASLWTGVVPRDDLGRQRTDSLVPCGYDNAAFPDFSWRDADDSSASLGYRPGLLVARQIMQYTFA